MFDRDGRGCIDVKELQQALQTMGEPVEDDDIKEMCKLAGVDGDGKLNYYGEQLQQSVFRWLSARKT